MRIGMLGTGMVGRTLATRLVELGHEVRMGARSADNEHAAAFAAAGGSAASAGTFADAAGFGELVVNATAGTASFDALRAAGAERLAGKVVVDVANALDFSGGFPPRIAVGPNDSVGERLQAAFPDARVVKTLNTVNAALMVDPGQAGIEHVVFLSGDDDAAKAEVRELLGGFGWGDEQVLDLGGIATARGPEMYLQLWLGVAGALGGVYDFNVAIARGA
jgi:8-hydroxy-5-deazaflavin:NADPH oxidoreductase